MTYKSILLLFLTTIFAFTLNAQNFEWIDIMNSPNPNIKEAKASFDKYWENKPYEKGKGVKPFMRWYNRMQIYADSNGNVNRVNEAQVFTDYLFKSKYFSQRSSAANWTKVGPETPPGYGIGRINAVAFHPTNAGTMYAGSPSGGAWKTVDGGQNWTILTEDLPHLGVADIDVDPNNPNVLWIATGDNDGRDTECFGILKSVDGGNTWNIVLVVNDTTQGEAVEEIIINPNNSNNVIAATSDGIMRTTDGGNTWTRTFGGAYEDIHFKPGDPNVVYASGAFTNIFARSIDNGVSWTNLSNSLFGFNDVRRSMMAVTPANPDYIYIVFSNTANDFKGVWRSTDGGSSFTMQSNSPNIFNGQAWYDLAISVSNTNPNEVIVGEVEMYRSSNGGVTWQNRMGAGSGEIHVDIHDIEFHPITNQMVVGCDGGFYTSSNGGSSYNRLCDGMNITQFYKMGASATSETLILAGSQDNGTFRKQNGNWDRINGGDGMDCSVDWSDNNFYVVSSQYGNFRKIQSGFAQGMINQNETGEPGDWVTPMIQHPVAPATWICGYQSIWQTTNRGNNWSNVSGRLVTGTQTLTDLAISPSNPNTQYATNGSALYITQDNWNTKQVASRTSWGEVEDILVDPDDHMTLYLAQAEGVYKSVNGGLAWQNISAGLPDLPVTALELDKESTNKTMYCGLTIGVYVYNDSLLMWEPFLDDLPRVRVSELQIFYPTRKLRASTYGRGIYESDLLSRGYVSVNETPLNVKDLTAYPNPNNGLINIEFTGEKSQVAKIDLINPMGQIIEEKNIQIINGNNQLAFNITDYPAGVYMIRLQNDASTYFAKVIKL